LEKAQDRNKRANLDNHDGNSKTYNPFSILSNSKILDVAATIKISLGEKKNEKVSSLARIQELDSKRVEECKDRCDTCKVVDVDTSNQLVGATSHEGNGWADPSTPISQIIRSQCEIEVDAQDQWTPVVNRKN
jgi:hypothetical protein